MRRLIVPVVFIATFALSPFSALGEVTFPNTRKAVGPGELYLLDEFESWSTECLREKDGEDICWAATTIVDLDQGLKLFFDVNPSLKPKAPNQADVDVAPRAIIEIAPYSSAKHYEAYSAAITQIDDEPFDGYWCELTDTAECNQGPELAANSLARLLEGRRATITIYDRDATPEEYTEITTIEVDLRPLLGAFNRAHAFTADVFGVDLTTAEIPTQMCTLRLDQEDKRVSYTFDEDFHSRSTSLRESMRGPKGAGNCPSYVTLAFLTPDMTSAQRELFCLVHDDETSELLGIQQGEQDAYRSCRAPSQSFCERVNNSKESALAITGFASGAVGSAVGASAATGTSVVLHSSGAAILSGSGGYIAGTLGTIGTTALGVLTAPATVAAATISVVAVGGAVYVCGEG